MEATPVAQGPKAWPSDEDHKPRLVRVTVSDPVTGEVYWGADELACSGPGAVIQLGEKMTSGQLR